MWCGCGLQSWRAGSWALLSSRRVATRSALWLTAVHVLLGTQGLISSQTWLAWQHCWSQQCRKGYRHGLRQSSPPRPEQPPAESKADAWDAGASTGAWCAPVLSQVLLLSPLLFFGGALTLSQVGVENLLDLWVAHPCAPSHVRQVLQGFQTKEDSNCTFFPSENLIFRNLKFNAKLSGGPQMSLQIHLTLRLLLQACFFKKMAACTFTFVQLLPYT